MQCEMSQGSPGRRALRAWVDPPTFASIVPPPAPNSDNYVIDRFPRFAYSFHVSKTECRGRPGPPIQPRGTAPRKTGGESHVDPVQRPPLPAAARARCLPRSARAARRGSARLRRAVQRAAEGAAAHLRGGRVLDERRSAFCLRRSCLQAGRNVHLPGRGGARRHPRHLLGKPDDHGHHDDLHDRREGARDHQEDRQGDRHRRGGRREGRLHPQEGVHRPDEDHPGRGGDA